MKDFIKLDSLTCKKNTLDFRFSSSLDLFARKNFHIKYDQPIPIPNESIHAVPFAALMTPLCWATGADLIIPSLDKEFAASLERCSGYWKKCFPRWPFLHRLVTSLVENHAPDASRLGMLFSGGVDSLCTYLRHRDEKPELFVVMGADVPETETDFIKTCKEKIFDDLARSEGIPLNYIHTDMRDILQKNKMKRFASNWYGAVQFSLMLTSLTAPLSYTYLKKLIIAACSHTTDHRAPCAGDPEVVRNIRWCNTEVQDDLNELSRVEKVARFLKPHKKFYEYLRVCWKQFDEINCGKCEKCYRTLCGLLVNNMDPNEANFKMDPGSLPALRSKLLSAYNLFFRGNETVLDYWRDIQRSIDLDTLEDIHGSRDFFEWFSRFDRIKRNQPGFVTKAGILREKIMNKNELWPYLERKILSRWRKPEKPGRKTCEEETLRAQARAGRVR